MKTILTPVDFSGVTEAVIAAATTLAQAFKGRIVLLSVIPPSSVGGYAPMAEDLGEVIAAGERAAAMNLARLEKQVERAGIPVESVQLNGSPVAHILEQARTAVADYIVMGSHGHTAIYDLLVGSTTQGVLKRAVCPVVVVPSNQRKGDVLKTKG